MKYTILLFEDEPELRQEIKDCIAFDSVEVYAFESWAQYKEAKIDYVPRLAVLDINLLDMDGLTVFQGLKERYPDIEGIVITGQASLKNAIESLKLGVMDYIEKPFRSKDIRSAIEKCESYKQFRVKNYVVDRQFEESRKKFEAHWGIEFIGISQPIKEINTLMKRVAQADMTSVMVTGESGSGKELIARGIHSMSDRSGAPFYPVNCTAIPDTLFESEFFGYQKGAFTGALSNHEGWFEHANGGTLFLDEIGDMNLALQSKLLRVLDERKVTRIGSHDIIPVNTRIVCATNKDLKQMIEDGQFRLDLYHRLNSFHIHIPPLRERNEDIPVLVNHFVRHFAEMHNKGIVSMHSKAMNLLVNHHYPGNIRELKNVIERAILMCDTNVIKAHHLNFTEQSENGKVQVDYSLESIERETIIKAMKACSHNKTHTAEKLNITRQALNRKLKKHGIE
ncbi:sigma-54-dependent transcriptional regulator [Carboxylicivirga marina]|uniref:Sigma-54-dependent Fis family transcriptional regulator n=1 Tax=Carboxylicivirga marina TaxID=2800988 RepID=A0ABS1HKZ7_9BACT|nr:sigma-54 dependent transcriptional regulator [Carboxylicivirga marina]MBK3518349.1 sigma-54-dependent Fis family transcriptional regulator [Carboxylicivirga marina]